MADEKKDVQIKSTYVHHDMKFAQKKEDSSMFKCSLYNDMVQFTIAKQNPQSGKFDQAESIYFKDKSDAAFYEFFKEMVHRVNIVRSGRELEETGDIVMKNRAGTTMLVGSVFKKETMISILVRIRKKEKPEDKEYTLDERHYFGGGRSLYRTGDPKGSDYDAYQSLETLMFRFQSMMAGSSFIKQSHMDGKGFSNNNQNGGSEGKGNWKGSGSSYKKKTPASDSYDDDTSGEFPF